MDRYDQLYRLYEEFDTRTLLAYREFVDLLPPVDSRVALEYWERASDELAGRTEEIAEAFGDDAYAGIAAHATRDQAFTALDLYAKYGRAVNVLVLDVDETLRSAGGTDNEIPRGTLHLLTEFHERGVPIVVCTGQTLENVKGFMIQGLGNSLVHSGTFSVVYEAGTGVFTPGHGSDTKRLLYEGLDDAVRDTFDELRSGVLSSAPGNLRREVHLQGNEFNVTLKPNFETGSDEAVDVIDRGLVHLLDLLGMSVARRVDADPERGPDWTRAVYAASDPEIRTVLDRRDADPDLGVDDVPDEVRDFLGEIEVAYYEGDAAEIASRELNKVVGVEAAIDVLGVDDPFALVMGDSKSDLRVMEHVAETGTGISAAPDHASRDVLDHVIRTDELLFDRGRSADILRTVYALDCLADLDG